LAAERLRIQEKEQQLIDKRFKITNYHNIRNIDAFEEFKTNNPDAYSAVANNLALSGFLKSVISDYDHVMKSVDLDKILKVNQDGKYELD
jgi:hypothetical protein